METHQHPYQYSWPTTQQHLYQCSQPATAIRHTADAVLNVRHSTRMLDIVVCSREQFCFQICLESGDNSGTFRNRRQEGFRQLVPLFWMLWIGNWSFHSTITMIIIKRNIHDWVELAGDRADSVSNVFLSKLAKSQQLLQRRRGHMTDHFNDTHNVSHGTCTGSMMDGWQR